MGLIWLHAQLEHISHHAMSYYYDSNQVVLGGANVGQDLFASGKLWFKVFYLIPFPSMT